MNDTLKAANRLLRHLMARGVGVEGAAVHTEHPEKIVFPSKTIDDFESLETRFDDETTSSSVVKYIADLGGRDVQDTVCHTMITLIDKCLANQFNFRGIKGKRKFEGLNITGIIFRRYALNKTALEAASSFLDQPMRLSRLIRDAILRR